VDTTGAGDCFCGALTARLAAGEAIWDALSYAQAAASISVTRPGAAGSMPSRDEVLKLLA
jgi:ribokinase